MAVLCQYCNSPDMQAEASTWLCINCGRRTPNSVIVAQGQKVEEQVARDES